MQVTNLPAHDIQTGTLVDLGDASSQLGKPAAEVNGQRTVPPSTSKPSEEDFDMFAQSRQSFEENLPRVKYVTYIIAKTLVSLMSLNKLWWSKSISLQIKLSVLKRSIFRSMLYACETDKGF